MATAAVRNQAATRWYTFPDILTMCLASISIYAAVLADSIAASNVMLADAADVYPVAGADTIARNNVVDADDADLFACRDED